MNPQTKDSSELATLAGGCFWCLEPLFDELRGVQKVVVGYSGGEVEHPTYREVCSGTTGHAEALQIEYDPGEIPFEDLLRVFFAFHDPTTRDRQGADVGTQYRSAVFFHSAEQEQTANRVVQELTAGRVWPRPIVTEIAPYRDFYPAEDYHQQYYRKNQGQGYCQVMIAPKLAKFRKEHLDRLKSPNPG